MEKERVSESKGAIGVQRSCCSPPNRPPICADPPLRPPPHRDPRGSDCCTLKLPPLWASGWFSGPRGLKSLLWFPTVPCPTGLLTPGCPFSLLHQHPIPRFPQAAASSCIERSMRTQTPTFRLLPEPCPSQRHFELRQESKATGRTGLRSEQDKSHKMLKSRDRKRRNTPARCCHYSPPPMGCPGSAKLFRGKTPRVRAEGIRASTQSDSFGRVQVSRWATSAAPLRHLTMNANLWCTCPLLTYKNIQTCREILCVSLSRTVDNCREAESQPVGILLRRMAVFHLVLYVTVKGGDVAGSHEVCW